MAFIDNTKAFSAAQSLSTTSDVVSTNVYDAGSAKKVYAGASRPKIGGFITMTGGTGTLSWRARLVGADDAGLTTNPIILADTGVMLKGPDGATALANTDKAAFELHPTMQPTAKRYYGVVWILGGTTPTATGSASEQLDPASNMLAVKAAAP
jgi:hypothetical protein